MSYQKTTWSDGDVITANKLNNIENGVEAIDNDISQINTDVSALQTQVDTLEELVENIQADIPSDYQELVDSVTNLQGDLSELGEAIYTPTSVTWARGIVDASGAITSGNGATLANITGAKSLELANTCRAVILLYSGLTYLGKLNGSGGIDKASGNWKYFTGTVDISQLFEEFSADGFICSVLPTDGTTITTETVQTYGDSHCDVIDVNIITLEQFNAVKTVSDANATAISTLSTPLKMGDYYENFEISVGGNMYTIYPNTGTPQTYRARIKQEFIQKVPDGATKVNVVLSSAIFNGTKYRVSFGFYDANYKQISNNGWKTSATSFIIDVPENSKYYMLYAGTNTASIVDLSELTNDGCSVRFDVNDYNYIEKERIANQNVLDLRNTIDEAESTLDTVETKVTAFSGLTNIRVVNHRGYYTAPENTIPAFLLSAEKGYLYVETDVLFTAPDETNLLGVPVLLHDATINRTARNADGTAISETINIADITYAEALEYDFGIYKKNQYAGTKIPTFAEFISFCKVYSLHPFIELKNEKTYSQDEIDLILTIVKQYGMKDHVSFISYSADALSLVKNRWDDVELGLNGSLSNTLALRTDKNRVFNLARSSESATFIQNLIDNNVPICRWTIDSISTLTSMDKSYDAILTNQLTINDVKNALIADIN